MNARVASYETQFGNCCAIFFRSATSSSIASFDSTVPFSQEKPAM
jgi:hypothetical protein